MVGNCYEAIEVVNRLARIREMTFLVTDRSYRRKKIILSAAKVQTNKEKKKKKV